MNKYKKEVPIKVRVVKKQKINKQVSNRGSFGIFLPAVVALFLVAQIVAPVLVNAVVIPNNKVGISMYGFVLSGAYSAPGGQPAGVGEIKNGNVGAYPEGACVPIEIEVKNKDNQNGDIIVSPVYDYLDGGTNVGVDNLENINSPLTGNPRLSADNLNDFSYPGTSLANTTFAKSSGGTVSATVSGPYSGNDAGTSAVTATDSFRHYNITLLNVPQGDTVYVMLCARLGRDASLYSGGAAMSVRTAQGGNENVPIPVNQLLALPSLTITKTVLGGTATPNQWTFTISPTINGQSSFPIPTGEDTVVIDNVSPDGSYTITESGPMGYNLVNVSGQNCVYQNPAGIATVAAGKPATNATCVFTNQFEEPTTGTLTVAKVVVNDNGGTKTASDFSFSVNGDPAVAFEADGQNDLTVPAGTYTVTEPAVSGYSTAYNNCSQVNVPAGGSATCTITNDDQPASLTVIKHVINDDQTGNNVASDFTMTVTGINVSQTSFAGSETGVTVTLDAGSYSVDESDSLGYTKIPGTNCSGTIANGEQLTCTITNDDLPPQFGLLTVIKQVINDNGGSKIIQDFSLFVDAISVSSGQQLPLAPGVHAVSEGDHTGYVQSFGGDCDQSGNVNVVAGQSYSCNITNDDIQPKLTVTKVVIGGQAQVGDFSLFVGQTQVTSGVENGFNAGNYLIFETGPAGYDSAYTGDCDAQGNITLALGDVKSCTITNTFRESPPVMDLSVSKTVDNESPETGATLTYTVAVTNNSTVSVGNVFVSDSLPSSVTFSEATTTHGSYAGGVWTIGTLTAGETATLEIKATVNSGTEGQSILNTAVVDESDEIFTENDLTNNTASAASNVPALPPPPPPPGGGGGGGGGFVPTLDMGVAKIVDKSSALEGDSVVYTITATNNSSGMSATSAVVNDLLPSKVTFVSSSATLGTYNAVNGIWDIGLLSPGASAVLTLTVKVNTGTAGTSVTNTASVDDRNSSDSNSANNSASVDFAVSGVAGAVTEGKVLGESIEKPTQVLAETGFDASELALLLFALFSLSGTALHLRKKIKSA